jgi:serine/threonine-protein kinase
MTTTPVQAPEQRTEPDLSGRRLGDYQFLRRLGRGGMAEVYLAEQVSLRRQVAIKVLRSNLALDEAYVRRFHHEAQAAAKLVHANIVQIHEVGCVEGWHYIAQEYVPGQNLKQLLGRLGHGLSAPQGVNVIRQVAAALHKAAEHNITHRDIKPENIMLASNGDVKVADFGLARVAQGGEALNLTQVGITMGTPLYMSPEQVEGKEVDPRSDIYSLGVTSYHMLAGRPPFDGETALVVAVQHLKQEPERLEALLPDFPAGLCRIVHKMLAKDPKQRYQKAIDILKDLKTLQVAGLEPDWAADLPGWSAGEAAAILEGRLAATQELGRVMRSEQSAVQRSWTIRRRALAAVALLVGAVLVGGAAAWFTGPLPLLEFPDNQLMVKKFDGPREQFFYATMVPGDKQERAYRAVSQYFPPSESEDNLICSRLATRNLAYYYFTNRRLSEALREYESLTQIKLKDEPSAKKFYLAGIAGCAIVYDRDGQEELLNLCLPILYSASEEELRQIGDTLFNAVQELLERHQQQQPTD